MMALIGETPAATKSASSSWKTGQNVDRLAWDIGTRDLCLAVVGMAWGMRYDKLAK